MTSWTKLSRGSALAALAMALAAPVAVQAQEITATVTGEVVSDGTPIANLHLTLLDKLGVPVDRFADSSGSVAV